MDLSITAITNMFSKPISEITTQKTSQQASQQSQGAIPNNQQSFKAQASAQQENVQTANTQQNSSNVYFKMAQTETNLNAMSNLQKNMLLRDALGLPKDWANLLKEFSIVQNNQLSGIIQNLNAQSQNSIQESLLLLLNSNAKFNLQALAMQLKENSALMSDKLMKYFSSANMSSSTVSQMKEIMLIGASIANSANVNPQEFLRDIMQMYLPWLPLVPPTEEDLNELEMKFAKEDNTDCQTLFYLSTKHAGYYKIEIFSGETSEIYITNVSKLETDILKEQLCAVLRENIKKSSIKAKFFFSRKYDEKLLNLKDKQLIVVNSDNSIISLTLMHLLARVIFEFDEKQVQRFQKAEKSISTNNPNT